MKVVVASPVYSGTQYAHVINTFKHANAFANLGHDVEIICYEGDLANAEELAEFYGVSPSITWTLLASVRRGKTLNNHADFTKVALPKIIFNPPDMIFARAYHFPYITSMIGIPTYVESHAHLNNRTKPFLQFVEATRHHGFRKWITISEYLKKGYANLGADISKIQVLPDAVDETYFKKPDNYKQKSPFKREKKAIVYTGHLYDYKGIPTIIEVAKSMPEHDFHLVGGLVEDISRHKRVANDWALRNIYFHGMVNHSEVGFYLWNADLLLLTHQKNHPSSKWTSPVKLAEYMMSETPIIVADIPALRDWLNEDEVFFYEPDLTSSLHQSINKAFSTSQTKEKSMREKRLKKVENWTYNSRVRSIIND